MHNYQLQVQLLTAERDDLLNQLKCLQKHASNTESSLAQGQVYFSYECGMHTYDSIFVQM